MPTPKSKTKLQSLMIKLLPVNILPRKAASQLRRRIEAARVSYRSYIETYGEVNPPDTPRSRKDKLKTVLWLILISLTFLVAVYFASQGYSIPG